MEPREFHVGDRVVKDPATWQPSEFDQWGAGEGVGVVVDLLDAETVDVRWPAGREYRRTDELLPAPDARRGDD